MTKKELLEKIKNIQIIVDGGGDSGEVNIEGIDDSDLLDAITDIVYDTIDYGSFAGEFQVNLNSTLTNEGIYLNGNEVSYESRENEIAEEFEIDIPENLIGIIDSLNIYASDGDSENIRVNIKNGIWNDELDEFEKNILDKFIEVVESNTEHDRYYIDENIKINKEQNSIKIKIDFWDYYEEEKSFYIDYDDILNKLKVSDDEEK